MASSYERWISFFIIGNEISNDIQSIRAEMTKLINEQARMKIGSLEFPKTASGKCAFKGIMSDRLKGIWFISILNLRKFGFFTVCR